MGISGTCSAIRRLSCTKETATNLWCTLGIGGGGERFRRNAYKEGYPGPAQQYVGYHVQKRLLLICGVH